MSSGSLGMSPIFIVWHSKMIECHPSSIMSSVSYAPSHFILWRGYVESHFLEDSRMRVKESGESDMIWFSSIPRLSKFRKFCCFYTQTFRNILYFVSRDKIWEILCQRRADRVIVTHGTDTIIQTGNFLDGDTKVFLNQKNVNLIQYTIFQKKSGSQKGMIY